MYFGERHLNLLGTDAIWDITHQKWGGDFELCCCLPIFALVMFWGLDLVLLSLNHIRIEIRESNFRNLVMVGFADENKTVTITYQICVNLFAVKTVSGKSQIIIRELKQRRWQWQWKRHPKIYLYFICATSRLFQLAQLLQKWQTIQEPNW